MDFLPEDILEYSERFTEPESEVLKELSRETQAKVLRPRMLSGHLQGRFLAMFSKLVSPKLILEIGTYTGYSAICLAEGLAEGGHIHTIDYNDELESMSTRYFKKAGIADRVTLHTGNALEVIPGLNGNFDLIFIDADKQNYLKYFNLVVDRLSPGGYILADNVLWSGKVLDEQEREKDEETRAIHEFNQMTSSDERIEPLLLPLRDGLMILRKK